MYTIKTKAAAVVLALSVFAGAEIIVRRAAAQDDNRPRAEEQKQARSDVYGDPLPRGAIFRFGSVRWRHGDGICASVLSPDGKLLATAASRSVAVWDLEAGKPVHRFPCDHGSHFCTPGITFSPDGKHLGYVRGHEFACVWEVKTGKEVRHFEGNRNSSCCQFTPDGKEFILTDRDRVRFYDLESGKEMHSIPTEYISFLSPDAKTYVRIEENKAVILGDARTGKETLRLDVAATRDGIRNGVAFTPDGKTLAVVHQNKEIQVRDAASGTVRVTFPLPDSAQERVAGRDRWEYGVGFSSDGKTLLLGTVGGVVHHWDLAAKRELPPLRKHLGAVSGFHSLADGQTLVSTGQDGSIRRWDARTGRELPGLEGYLGSARAAYSPDGRFVAVADSRGQVDLQDAASGKRLRTLQQEGPAFTNLVFAPDSKSLAVGQKPGTVQFWEVPSGREGKVLRWEAWNDWAFVGTIVFSPDGKHLCVADYAYQTHLWEVATGKACWHDTYYCPAFTPDGAMLVAALGGLRLLLLDTATGKERFQIQLDWHEGDRLSKVEAVAFSPDGQRLAVALRDGHVALHDARTGAQLKRFLGVDPLKGQDPLLRELIHRGVNRVGALAFSPDGKWLASGGHDAAVKVWEVATGKEVLRLDGHEGEVLNVAFGPDGRTILSSGKDAQAYLWDLRPRPAPKAALDALWTDLAAAEPAKAYRAVWALADDSKTASDFLRKKIVPVKPVDKDRLAKLIADLDSDRFAVRDAADKELAELGRLAAPALEEALKKRPSLEVARRMQNLLDTLKGVPTPAELREMRAAQALELSGTPEARRVLREWAGGAPGARLTEDAKAALDRLAKRSASP